MAGAGAAGWVRWAWALLLLAATAHCGARLVLAGRARLRGDGATEAVDVLAVDVLMGAGLVAMASPPGAPVPAAVGEAAFGLLVAWSLAAALRARELGRRVAGLRQAVAGAAMAPMFAAMSVGTPLPALLGWALATYFGCSAAWSAGLAVASGFAVLGEERVMVSGAGIAWTWPARLLAPRVASLCDAVMAAAMVYLLVAMR